jgi:FAD binding domain-containing protein/berberine-like enzyme
MTTNGAPRSPAPPRTVNVADLRKSFSGVVITPDDDRYDEARTVWNAMVDKRPAVIVRPESAADVAAAIAFARRADLEIGVRGGGHSVTGMAVPEDGLMIDLRSMAGAQVDTDRRRALVGGGALLGELDRAAQAHGLATTAGNVSVTGVGGLTLGGGMGWLARQFGLTCDNVVGAEVVTADGTIVRTSATSEPDLFWAIRGGGGNFGVVTEFEFRLHPMTGSALVVDFFYELDRTAEVLRVWRELAPVAPREATYTAWVGNAPAWPFLPEELHGRLLGNAGFVWIGDPDEGRRLIPSLRSVAEPIAQSIEEMTYLVLQTSGDASNQPGNRRYWKGRYMRELPDTAIDAFLGRDARTGQPEANAMLSAASMQVYGGAIADPPDGDNAFGQRDAVFEVVTSVSWADPAEDDARMRGARTVAAAIEPFASGAYVNSLSDEGESGMEIAYSSDRLQRMAAIKDRYDPDNVFHLNHNVRPARALASTR